MMDFIMVLGATVGLLVSGLALLVGGAILADRSRWGYVMMGIGILVAVGGVMSAVGYAVVMHGATGRG